MLMVSIMLSYREIRLFNDDFIGFSAVFIVFWYQKLIFGNMEVPANLVKVAALTPFNVIQSLSR